MYYMQEEISGMKHFSIFTENHLKALAIMNIFAAINKRGEVSVTNAFGPAAPCSKLDDPRIEKIRKAVVETAKQLQFEPPMKDGKPTEIEMYLTYRFDKAGKPLHQPLEGFVEEGVLQGRIKY